MFFLIPRKLIKKIQNKRRCKTPTNNSRTCICLIVFLFLVRSFPIVALFCSCTCPVLLLFVIINLPFLEHLLLVTAFFLLSSYVLSQSILEAKWSKSNSNLFLHMSDATIGVFLFFLIVLGKALAESKDPEKPACTSSEQWVISKSSNRQFWLRQQTKRDQLKECLRF